MENSIASVSIPFFQSDDKYKKLYHTQLWLLYTIIKVSGKISENIDVHVKSTLKSKLLVNFSELGIFFKG